MKISLHRIVLIILINLFPKLFERYHKEYQEVMNIYFKDKEK